MGRGGRWRRERRERHRTVLLVLCSLTRSLQMPSSSREYQNSWENPRTAWLTPANFMSFQCKPPHTCAGTVLCWCPAGPRCQQQLGCLFSAEEPCVAQDRGSNGEDASFCRPVCQLGTPPPQTLRPASCLLTCVIVFHA